MIELIKLIRFNQFHQFNQKKLFQIEKIDPIDWGIPQSELGSILNLNLFWIVTVWILTIEVDLKLIKSINSINSMWNQSEIIQIELIALIELIAELINFNQFFFQVQSELFQIEKLIERNWPNWRIGIPPWSIQSIQS